VSLVSRERGNPWSGVRLPRGRQIANVLVGCWGCGDTVNGRLPGFTLARSSTVVGIIPLCPSCVARIPPLDPDPLTVPS
jgi:hypothetical protein